MKGEVALPEYKSIFNLTFFTTCILTLVHNRAALRDKIKVYPATTKRRGPPWKIGQCTEMSNSICRDLSRMESTLKAYIKLGRAEVTPLSLKEE